MRPRGCLGELPGYKEQCCPVASPEFLVARLEQWQLISESASIELRLQLLTLKGLSALPLPKFWSPQHSGNLGVYLHGDPRARGYKSLGDPQREEGFITCQCGLLYSICPFFYTFHKCFTTKSNITCRIISLPTQEQK